MNARALHQSTDGFAIRRWSVCAAVVVALHAGAILAGAAWYAESPPPGTDTPAILIDMAPVSSAPAVQPTDLPPGPDMDEAEAPAAKPPEPPKAEIEQPIAPTPPQENPIV